MMDTADDQALGQAIVMLLYWLWRGLSSPVWGMYVEWRRRAERSERDRAALLEALEDVAKHGCVSDQVRVRAAIKLAKGESHG